MNKQQIVKILNNSCSFHGSEKATDEVAEQILALDTTFDLDAKPYVPDGWTIEEHAPGGQFVWDPGAVRLHLDDAQRGGSIEGNQLRKKLIDLKPMSATLLDRLLERSHLIPEEWKGKYVYFWGTVYRDSGGLLYVRYLCWDDGRWLWSCHWLDDDWGSGFPAVVPAS